MELFGFILAGAGILSLLFLVFVGMMHMSNVWELMEKYWINGECRHKFDKWSAPEINGTQYRTCEKCGIHQRKY